MPKKSKITYIIYSKPQQLKAEKLMSNATVKTFHALAYQNIVRPYNLQIGNLTPYAIKTKINRPAKQEIIKYFEQFCLSEYHTVDEYIEEYYEFQTKEFEILLASSKLTFSVLASEIKSLMGSMFSGAIKCTHGFYMKMFQLDLLNNRHRYKEIDLLILDEANDASKLTLEVFSMYPAKKRVMVGDPYQALFQHVKCYNGFDYFRDVGVSMFLEKSYRCSPEIAKLVKDFMVKHVDKKFKFVGTDNSGTTDDSILYLSATNTGMIHTAIKLHQDGVKYRFERDVANIFGLPLFLMTMKFNQYKRAPEIRAKEFKYLQKDVNNWHAECVVVGIKSFNQYMADRYSHDIGIVSACGLVRTYGNILYEVRDGITVDAKARLSTVHTAKGGEANTVYINEDLNKAMEDAIEAKKVYDSFFEMPESLKTVFYSYYVACTRAINNLHNATYLYKS